MRAKRNGSRMRRRNGNEQGGRFRAGAGAHSRAAWPRLLPNRAGGVYEGVPDVSLGVGREGTTPAYAPMAGDLVCKQNVQNHPTHREEDNEQRPKYFSGEAVGVAAHQIHERQDVEHDNDGAAEAPLSLRQPLNEVRPPAPGQQQGRGHKQDGKDTGRNATDGRHGAGQQTEKASGEGGLS